MMATAQPQTKPLAIKELSAAQRRQLQNLVIQLTRADWDIEQAQSARDKAQANANNFLAYCADEQGIKLGEDGWAWDQNDLRFVQKLVPIPEATPALPAPVPHLNGDGS